jgi:hypothetical protein
MAKGGAREQAASAGTPQSLTMRDKLTASKRDRGMMKLIFNLKNTFILFSFVSPEKHLTSNVRVEHYKERRTVRKRMQEDCENNAG